MVGQKLPTVHKPSRSDEIIDPDHQLHIAQAIRAHFESISPNRPTKPNRSEPDPDATLARHQSHPEPIHELQRLHSLKSHSQVVLTTEVKGAVQEEFVETEYYKQMEIIDKQHHTTGTGFIKVAKGANNGEGYDYQVQKLSENGKETKTGNSGGCRSNPATNDWTPSFEEDDQYEILSTKPRRSG